MTETRNIARSSRWCLPGIALGACLGMAACSGGGAAAPEEPATLPRQQLPGVADAAMVIEDAPPLAAAALIPQSPPASSKPSAPPAPAAAGALPRMPLSTSGAEATAEQVWGEVIGGNVGAAQSCGGGNSKIEAYRDRAQRYLSLRHLGSTLPGDYQLAYEDARRKSASVPRREDECAEILAALDQ